MSVYYMIHMFVDLGRTEPRRIVQGAVNGLLRAGCQYLRTTVSTVLNPDAPPKRHQITEKLVDCSLDRAIELTTIDLTKWGREHRDWQFVPLVELTFECDFELDEAKNQDCKPPNNVRSTCPSGTNPKDRASDGTVFSWMSISLRTCSVARMKISPEGTW